MMASPTSGPDCVDLSKKSKEMSFFNSLKEAQLMKQPTPPPSLKKGNNLIAPVPRRPQTSNLADQNSNSRINYSSPAHLYSTVFGVPNILERERSSSRESDKGHARQSRSKLENNYQNCIDANTPR